MHEMGIALEIIDIVVASIPEDLCASLVKKVNVQIGKLSGVTSDSLRFCFNIAVKSSVIFKAKLFIEEIPVVVKCSGCKVEWTIDKPVFICKYCQSTFIDIISGRELDVRSIEIDTEE